MPEQTASTSRVPALIAVLLATAGCGEPATEMLPRWTAESQPALSIGVREGEPPYMFDRITGLVERSDGSLVVANTGSHEIRAFDAAGAHLWTRGGEGDGPGEYRGDLALALLPGDSLVVFDWLARRLTVLDASGGVASTASLPDTLPNLELVGAMGDGTAVVSARHLTLSPGLNTDSVSYHRLTPGGRVLDGLGWSPGSRVFFLAADGPPAIEEQPFAPRTSTAVLGTTLLIATGEEPEIVRRRSGGATDTIRWSAGARPIGEGLIEAWRARHLERSSLPPPIRRRWQEEAPIPDHLPYASGLLAENASRFWVREWSPEDEDAEWVVLDDRGVLLGRAVMPSRFEPFLVRDGRVIGVQRDELDVERVFAYRLERSDSASDVG